MTLNAWQERLSNHFANLRDRRLKSGPHANLYALEHELNEADIAELREDIHEFLGNSGPARRHYLAWVVYSAEIGYQYSGEEYWETFSRLTPNWDDSYRDHIRDAYHDFHRNFGATRPQGRWAEHFKIICWPINHAILPQDLQRELALVLYELRGSFTSELLHSPELFGRHIRSAAWNSKSRFRKFVEDHLLVGQISTALLLSDEEKDKSLILPSTLARITADLDTNRRSREWLGYARQRALQVKIRGLSRATGEELSENERHEKFEAATSLTPRQREVVELGLEPDLSLLRSAANAWEVRLKLPDLSHLIRRFPHFRETLSNQRCTIAGAKGRIFPRGYLLWGDQDVTLTNWPASDELLIRFEQSQADLDYLLTADCLLRPGPRWLFKLLNDGTAIHIKTGVVQPGASYIVITKCEAGPIVSSLASKSVRVSCEGISAVLLNVPETVSKIYSDELGLLNLHLSTGLEVAPIGIPAAKWNDAGSAEWLLTDQPMIKISADFEIEAILLNLVGPCSSTLELKPPSTWPLLVDLGKLDSGLYNLHVVISRVRDQTLVTGNLQFNIRAPRIWTGYASSGTPFRVHVSPSTPTLQELWEGRASLELLGPQDKKVEGELKFYAGSAEAFHEQKLDPVQLPCTQADWSEVWERLAAHKTTQNAYDASNECELILQCEELGRFVLRSSRESTPIRWIVKQQNNGYFLRLEQLDDHADVSFSTFSFHSPAEFRDLSFDPVSGFRVPESGGLFAASTDQFRSSVVIPPAIHSLKWLGADVDIPQATRSEAALSQLVNALEVWACARSVGSALGDARKTAVINAFLDEIIRLLCGDEWSKFERQYSRGLKAISDLKNAVSSAARHAPLGRDIVSRQLDFKTSSLNEIVEILCRISRSYLDLPVFSTARDHGVSRQQWVTEFAYRFVSLPESIRGWAQQDFVPAIGYLHKNPVLCRVARFARLLSKTPDLNGAKSKAVSL